MKRLLLVLSLVFSLTACDQIQRQVLGEDPAAKAARQEAEGKAVGGACRHPDAPSRIATRSTTGCRRQPSSPAGRRWTLTCAPTRSRRSSLSCRHRNRRAAVAQRRSPRKLPKSPRPGREDGRQRAPRSQRNPRNRAANSQRGIQRSYDRGANGAPMFSGCRIRVAQVDRIHGREIRF